MTALQALDATVLDAAMMEPDLEALMQGATRVHRGDFTFTGNLLLEDTLLVQGNVLLVGCATITGQLFVAGNLTVIGHLEQTFTAPVGILATGDIQLRGRIRVLPQHHAALPNPAVSVASLRGGVVLDGNIEIASVACRLPADESRSPLTFSGFVALEQSAWGVPGRERRAPGFEGRPYPSLRASRLAGA